MSPYIEQNRSPDGVRVSPKRKVSKNLTGNVGRSNNYSKGCALVGVRMTVDYNNQSNVKSRENVSASKISYELVDEALSPVMSSVNDSSLPTSTRNIVLKNVNKSSTNNVPPEEDSIAEVTQPDPPTVHSSKDKDGDTMVKGST